MRTLIIMIALLATGCAASTNDLIKDARASGQWAAVNNRLDAEVERERVDASCRSGFIIMCSDRCECVPNDVASSRIGDILGTHPGTGRKGQRRQRR